MNFEQWLAANGYDAEKLTATQKAHLTAAWKAETAPPPIAQPVVGAPTPATAPSGTPSYEVQLAEARAESDRRQKINEATEQYIRMAINFPDRIERYNLLRNAAVESKWDINRFNLEMLKESHNVGPIISVSRGKEITSEVLEAAACVHTRLPGVEKVFSDRVLDSANREFKSNGVSLLGLIEFGAKANGWRGHSVRSDLRNAMRYCNRGTDAGMDMRSEGPSTLDVSGILSNIANKVLKISFLAVERVWADFAEIRPVSDFKTITSYALTGDLTYDKVSPGGEIKSGTLGSTSYTNKADTYAKMLGIDRRDFINDDLGAFAGVSKRLGRGGALKINDVFYTDWLNDSTFFNTDKSHNNYDDGATDSVLSLAGLDNAYSIYKTQTDPDGKPLGSEPKILLVPTQLGVTALTLMAAAPTAAAQSTALTTIANPWAGKFRVVESQYLSNSTYSGYSTTAWYLLADPNDLVATQICFLNGAEMPIIETGEMDFDRLGFAMRGYHDFGVSKQEYRAGVKLKGAA